MECEKNADSIGGKNVSRKGSSSGKIGAERARRARVFMETGEAFSCENSEEKLSKKCPKNPNKH